jgi:site-specific recombinase XerD
MGGRLREGVKVPRKPKKVVGVYEREPGNWCGRYRSPEGKLVRKSFGPDRAAAIAWVEDARVVRRTGTLPISAKQAKAAPAEAETVKTIDVLCAEFLAYIQGHPEEYRDQKNPPRRIEEIRTAFEGRSAAGITAPNIEEWLAGVQEDRELANATINKLRGTFSMIYKHGKRRGLVDVNPAEDVPLKDIGNGIERFMSLDEERRLREVIAEDIAARDPERHPELRKQAMHRMIEFDVSIRSGMRRSEQFNLRWPDVDFDRRIMRLRMTKNGKPRNAFIIEDVRKALLTLKDLDVHRRKGKDKGDDLVFAKSDNKKWWAAALKDAGIENYRWHDNRHTFCSRLVQGGVHLKVVQEAAGHASIASTMRYAHFAPSQVVDAMAVLNWVELDHGPYAGAGGQPYEFLVGDEDGGAEVADGDLLPRDHIVE